MIHAKSMKNIWHVLFVVIIVSFDNEVKSFPVFLNFEFSD